MRGAGIAAIVLVSTTGCGRYGFTSEPADVRRDGASDDGPRDAKAPCAGFDLCDEFEANAIDTTVWSKDPSVTLDPARAHRGTASVHFHTNALAAGTGNYEVLSETRTLAGAVPPTTFWVRGWFFVPVLPAGANGLELISADQSVSQPLGNFVFLHASDTTLYTQFGNDITSGGPPPTNTWFCLVWKVVRRTTNTGSLEVSSDIVPTFTLANIRTDASPPITTIAIGLGWASLNVPVNQPAFDLWADDVIVHSAPVTCAD